MFQKLEQPLQDFYVFRCKNCHQILFSSEEVAFYVKSQLTSFGKLDHLSNYPKSMQPQSYFVFDQDFEVSSIFMSGESLLIKQHPFLMMHVNPLTCQQCQANIGFNIETVNQNTQFLLNRSMINTKALQVLRDQTQDDLILIVKNLDQILAYQKNLIQIQKNKKNKQRQKQNELIKEEDSAKIKMQRQQNFKQKQHNQTQVNHYKHNIHQNHNHNHNHNPTNKRQNFPKNAPLSFISKFQTRALASTNIQTSYMSFPFVQHQSTHPLKQKQKQLYNQKQHQKQKQSKPQYLQLKFADPSQIESISKSIARSQIMLKKWVQPQIRVRDNVHQILHSFHYFNKILNQKLKQLQAYKEAFVKMKFTIQNNVTQKLRKR